MTVTDLDQSLAARAPARIGQATAVEQSRAIAEVQAAVVVAQQCPRDLTRAESEMRDSCGRLVVANRAFYRVPNRGSGPSVHLARELARVWGNIQYGVHELRRDDLAGESEIQAFAWDLQTNSRSTRTFVVPHQRMKGGRRQDLTDLGDVYLNNQNVGARAVRECIFTVLPTWFTEAAQDLCRQTLENGEGEPLPSRIEKMVTAFRATYGVKPEQIEAKLGRKRGQWDAGDIATMTVTYASLQRGEVTVDEEFPTQRATAADFAPTPPTDDGGVDAPDVSDATSKGAAPVENATSAPPSQPEAAPMTARTRGRMFALFSDLGIGEDEQRSGISAVVGRPVESRGSLTEDEARSVIRRLEPTLIREGVER